MLWKEALKETLIEQLNFQDDYSRFCRPFHHRLIRFRRCRASGQQAGLHLTTIP